MSKRFNVARWIIFGLTVLWTAYIIYHSFLDASASSGASEGLAKLLQNIINTFSPNAINESNIDAFHGFLRKFIGHFSFFVVDGLLVSWTIYLFGNEKLKTRQFYIGIIISLTFGLLLASLTELIQLYTPGRSGEIKDVLIDFSGYLLGFLILFLICLIRILNKNKE